MCTGTPVHYEQTVKERVARPGRMMRRVCTGTPAHYEYTARNECKALPTSQSSTKCGRVVVPAPPPPNVFSLEGSGYCTSFTSALHPMVRSTSPARPTLPLVMRCTRLDFPHPVRGAGGRGERVCESESVWCEREEGVRVEARVECERVRVCESVCGESVSGAERWNARVESRVKGRPR